MEHGEKLAWEKGKKLFLTLCPLRYALCPLLSAPRRYIFSASSNA
jgi:hypothetical protein